MSKGFRAGKMANVALVIRYIQALHIKSYGSPFVSGMSGCEFSDCGWSKNFFSSIAAFIDQHLKKYCQVQAIGKQSCMSTYSIEHCGSHVVHVTVNNPVSEISILLGRNYFF